MRAKTYQVDHDSKGVWIVCFKCSKKSYHIEDVKNLYCGNCREFHEDLDDYKPELLSWIKRNDLDRKSA